MCATIREVVVFPLVPVTATIGIREGAPGGKSRSITGLATYCGSPIVGLVCIRNPGAALTSTMPPPASRTGSVMSTAMKSMPATSRPTTRAASSAISTLSGCASMRAVDRDAAGAHVRGQGQLHLASPCGEHVVAGRSPAPASSSSAASSRVIRVSTFSWPDAAARVGVGDLDELGDGVGAVADDVRGHPLGDGDHLPADDEEPVVVADEVGLDHDPAAAGLGAGPPSNAFVSAASSARFSPTPRPWLPSAGLTTTG